MSQGVQTSLPHLFLDLHYLQVCGWSQNLTYHRPVHLARNRLKYLIAPPHSCQTQSNEKYLSVEILGHHMP